MVSGRHKLANITPQKRKRSSRRPNKNTKSKASLLDVTEGRRERRTRSNTNSGPSSLYLEKGKNGENTNLLFCFVFFPFFLQKKRIPLSPFREVENLHLEDAAKSGGRLGDNPLNP